MYKLQAVLYKEVIPGEDCWWFEMLSDAVDFINECTCSCGDITTPNPQSDNKNNYLYAVVYREYP